MSEGDQLELDDFPLMLAGPQSNVAAKAAYEAVTVAAVLHQGATALVSGSDIPIAPLPSQGTLSMLTATGEMRPLEEMENEIIRFAISHYRGQMSEVARRLKIGRSTLYRKLDESSETAPVKDGSEHAGSA
jgi:DNA-binding NtrC family response regulator